MMMKQCVKYTENKRRFTLSKTCIFKTIPSIFMNLVSLESLLNIQLHNPKCHFLKSRQDVPFVILGHIMHCSVTIATGL